MNISAMGFKRFLIVVPIALFLFGCASQKIPDGISDARQQLIQLRSESTLAGYAPIEVNEAEQAVKAAEASSGKDEILAAHLSMIAERKVSLARAWAERRQFEAERKGLSEQTNLARLDSRTKEADRAIAAAESSKASADASRVQADLARKGMEAERLKGAAARSETAELKRQITELNARPTDRGLVVTLGDLLFDTNKSELKATSASHLDNLAAFLVRYEERSAIIEGHTDNTGDNAYNQSLSQRRAESVKAYLVSRGVAMNRLSAYGKGEGLPLANNDSSSGRQQNRRVEVIISGDSLTSR
jgi:outer membrane protein OmpA-like peptidoglycan-associated protein